MQPMPIRTINLKMILGEREESEEIRRSLWETHTLINRAVEKIERVLLLCRGRNYWTIDENGTEIEIPEGRVLEDSLKYARETQKKNGVAPKNFGSDIQVLSAMRNLYEKIVPSCLRGPDGKPQKGDAQSSNAWVSPIMDPSSEGGLSVYEKVLENSPAWIQSMIEEQPGWKKASEEWLQSEEALKLQRSPGSPPGWLRKLRAKHPWQESFIKDQEKKKKELAEGNAPLIKELKTLGLLPLLHPPIQRIIEPDGKGVSVWDRLATRLTVAHLLSWESWNYATETAHTAAQAKVNELIQKYDDLSPLFALLREYETDRHKELKKISFADDEKPFKIGARSIRAWDRVRESWLKNGSSQPIRLQILSELQTKLRGEFGDPDFFRWLAGEGRECLWREKDTIIPLVTLNVAQRLLEKRKQFSIMTFADPRFHPRWIMYEAPGGTNLKNYAIEKTEHDFLVNLNLIAREEDGGRKEKKFSVRLAPSGQLSQLGIITGEGKKKVFRFHSANQFFEGVPGGAEVLLDRTYLENENRSETLLSYKPGPIWLKLTLDVVSQAPAEWMKNGKTFTPPEVHHFKTALSNKSKHASKLSPGLRVLSVDLGLRTFASCSVFELVDKKPDKGFFFPAADERYETEQGKLWAKHIRSFKLPLPGETPSGQELQARRAAMDEVFSIKRDIKRLKTLLRLSVVEENGKRDEIISTLMLSLEESDMEKELCKEDFIGLGASQFRATSELWQTHCQNCYNKAEIKVSQRFSDWRKRTRPKSCSWEDWRERRNYHGGKSVWMLEYLEAVRKLIISWNLRGRSFGEVNRQNRKEYGTVASKLLRHINQLKEDRIKSGADLIIQATRGYVPVEKGWEKKNEPCRVILFEDIARYRFRVDRPRRENSRLMKWNHREICRETEMQAALYGIVVETTAAGFSSRFLASSGAPGVRCKYLKPDDFDQEHLPKEYVVRELDWMLGNTRLKDTVEKQRALKEKIDPGMLVPWNGGEIFASLKADGQAHIIHADINAAQNLQRRFWNRCSDAYRIVCKKISHDGETHWVLDNVPGVRLLGALQQLKHGDGPFFLAQNPGSETYTMQPDATRSKNKKKVKTAEGESENDLVFDELEDALEELSSAESGSDRETFFRDPSACYFAPPYWIPSKIFWGRVKRQTWEALRKKSYPEKQEEGNVITG